jgi:hypothetical protein
MVVTWGAGCVFNAALLFPYLPFSRELEMDERREKTYGYMPIKSYTMSRANYIGIGLKKA